MAQCSIPPIKHSREQVVDQCRQSVQQWQRKQLRQFRLARSPGKKRAKRIDTDLGRTIVANHMQPFAHKFQTRADVIHCCRIGVNVDPYDVSAIADALSLLLRDSETRSLYRARGLERAREFTWDATAART